MFRAALTEKTKREIARIYHTTDTSVEAIATQLNVSGRSIHRFKDYGYSTDDEPQIQPQETYPEKKHYSEDKIVFIGGKKHKGKNTKKSGSENENDTMTKEETQQEFEWECPKCGHQWDGNPDKCPKCEAELQE